MVNSVKGIEETDNHLILELNNSIALKIHKTHNNKSLNMSYGFDPKIITETEAKEIIDCFIASIDTGLL